MWCDLVGRTCGDVGVLLLGANVMKLVCSVWAPIWWCWCAVFWRPCSGFGVLWLGAHVVVL